MRLILIILGVALLLTIYFFGRWQQSRRSQIADDNEEPVRHEPMLVHSEAAADSSHLEQELADLEQLIAEDNPAASQPKESSATVSDVPVMEKEKLVVLHVIAPEGESFVGAEVKRSFEDEVLSFGAMDIYHHMARAPRDASVKVRPVFSVANLAEPGTFDPNAMETEPVKGFTLFLTLPGPISGEVAFEGMLASAQRLASVLNGELWDSTHSVLSRQTIQHIRDDIKGYEYRQRYRQRA